MTLEEEGGGGEGGGGESKMMKATKIDIESRACSQKSDDSVTNSSVFFFQ